MQGSRCRVSFRLTSVAERAPIACHLHQTLSGYGHGGHVFVDMQGRVSPQFQISWCFSACVPGASRGASQPACPVYRVVLLSLRARGVFVAGEFLRRLALLYRVQAGI